MKFKVYNNRKIFCIFLNKILYKSKNKFYPGIIGIYINENISEEAWKLWIIEQTKIINENLLNTRFNKDKIFLKIKMLNFFFQ